MDIQGIKYDGEDFYCTCDECGDIVQVFACKSGVYAECDCEPVCMDWFDLTIEDLEILRTEKVTMTVWRIRKSVDNEYLYSTGGTVPHFNKTGKFWRSKKDLIKHLKLINSNETRLPERHPYLESEIISSQIVDNVEYTSHHITNGELQ